MGRIQWVIDLRSMSLIKIDRFLNSLFFYSTDSVEKLIGRRRDVGCVFFFEKLRKVIIGTNQIHIINKLVLIEPNIVDERWMRVDEIIFKDFWNFLLAVGCELEFREISWKKFCNSIVLISDKFFSLDIYFLHMKLNYHFNAEEFAAGKLNSLKIIEPCFSKLLRLWETQKNIFEHSSFHHRVLVLIVFVVDVSMLYVVESTMLRIFEKSTFTTHWKKHRRRVIQRVAMATRRQSTTYIERKYIFHLVCTPCFHRFAQEAFFVFELFLLLATISRVRQTKSYYMLLSLSLPVS
jgi:hypothetical protein